MHARTRHFIGLAFVATVAACSGTTPGAAAPAAQSSSAVVSTSASLSSSSEASSSVAQDSVTTSTSSAPVTHKIGKTGWFKDFAVTVDEVAAQLDFSDSYAVTINFTYQNLGADAATPPEASIEVNGEVQSGLFDTPTIPGAGKSTGSVAVEVTPKKNEKLTADQALDSIVLVYGDATDNQTTIPLAASAKVESVEPKTLTVAGKLVQGPLDIEVVSGTLTPSYEPGDKGKGLLDLKIKISCAPDCAASGYNTGREEFSITGPDGNSVVADQRSPYCCDAIYPGTVSDNQRNVLTFVVALPGTGKYTLKYQNASLTASGTAPATFDFTA